MRISDWSSDVCSSDLFIRSENKSGVARIAIIRQQEDVRLEVTFAFDRIGFGRQIAFLNGIFVGQEGREIESIFANLFVGEAVLDLQPLPEGTEDRKSVV